MRALLVGAAPYAGNPGTVAELAEGHDLVIAIDGGGALCLRAGIVPDVVIGDFDSLDRADLEVLIAEGAEEVRFDAHKDQSDLELAVDMVRGKGVRQVTLTAISGGRLDHSLAAVGVLLRTADLHPELNEPDLRGWVLSGEARMDLELIGAGATVSLIALSEEAQVAVQGARWFGKSIHLRRLDSRGISNVIDSSAMRITVQQGTVLVLSPQDPRGLMARANG